MQNKPDFQNKTRKKHNNPIVPSKLAKHSMMELNKDQAAAVDAALDGHSVFITGQAGTGKTATIKAIMSSLKEKGKRMLVCCATVIAKKEGAVAGTLRGF